MIPLLSCQAISKTFGTLTLFTDISFGIFERDRIGLLGLNGSGKSTLMKILVGLESPDEGHCVLRRGIRVGYVPQERKFPENQTIEQALLESLNDSKMSLEMSEQLARLEVVLGQTGFQDRHKQACQLSGGWRKRLMIACELVREPDVLLLDEPTNHLDLEGLAWLEDLLLGATWTYLVISHDRLFLERTTKKIIELNHRYPNGYLSVDGNYSEFVVRREDFFTAQKATEDKLENRLRREVEWLRRGPKARTTKSQARIDEAHRLMGEVSDLKSKNLVKRAGIEFVATERETQVLIAAKNVKKGNLFENFTLNISKKMRLGLVGLNGSGKTTLLKILSGEIPPDSGTIKHAPDLKIVYFTQNRDTLKPTQTLRQALCPSGADHVVFQGRDVHVSSWAQRFLFHTDRLKMPVGKLSGGEQARLLIAQLMLRPADVLLLDEPTNDLDIPTLEILESNLEEFPGAVILVSHDRYLLDSFSTIILGLHGNGKTSLIADLRQWEDETFRAKKPQQWNSESSGDKPKKGSTFSVTSKKLSFKEKTELEGIETAIATAEARLTALQSRLNDPSVNQNPAELRKVSTDMHAAENEISRLYTRWSELETLAKSP